MLKYYFTIVLNLGVIEFIERKQVRGDELQINSDSNFLTVQRSSLGAGRLQSSIAWRCLL